MTEHPVLTVPAAAAADARAWFSQRLGFETDCADVHAALQLPDPAFVLLDVRSSAAFARGHVAGAVNLPRPELDPERLAAYPPETVFVVYCAGPHCNAAQRAALALAELGRPVKEMLGGVTGWLDEGFELATQ